MEITPLDIEGVFMIKPKRFGDERGFFSEVFKSDIFEEKVSSLPFIQDNHAKSGDPGIIRGLHFQKPPTAQGKLVRVTRGAVLDVIVDIRASSPTYGQHTSVELSADNWKQLWVPPGFAHAYCTLLPDTEFLYKVTAPYSPDDEGGLRFDDPDLKIDWPFPADKIQTSARDLEWTPFREFETPFD